MCGRISNLIRARALLLFVMLRPRYNIIFGVYSFDADCSIYVCGVFILERDRNERIRDSRAYYFACRYLNFEDDSSSEVDIRGLFRPPRDEDLTFGTSRAICASSAQCAFRCTDSRSFQNMPQWTRVNLVRSLRNARVSKKYYANGIIAAEVSTSDVEFFPLWSRLLLMCGFRFRLIISPAGFRGEFALWHICCICWLRIYRVDRVFRGSRACAASEVHFTQILILDVFEFA